MENHPIYEQIARLAGWISEKEFNGEDDGVRSPNTGDWAEHWKGACEQIADYYLRGPFNTSREAMQDAIEKEEEQVMDAHEGHVMALYRVALETSAAIVVEIEIEANDLSAAESKAQALYYQGRLKLSDLTAELLNPPDEELRGYTEKVGTPIVRVYVEEDEGGYEVIDSWEAD